MFWVFFYDYPTPFNAGYGASIDNKCMMWVVFYFGLENNIKRIFNLFIYVISKIMVRGVTICDIISSDVKVNDVIDRSFQTF